jgi:hypothetical protein
MNERVGYVIAIVVFTIVVLSTIIVGFYKKSPYIGGRGADVTIIKYMYKLFDNLMGDENKGASAAYLAIRDVVRKHDESQWIYKSKDLSHENMQRLIDLMKIVSQNYKDLPELWLNGILIDINKLDQLLVAVRVSHNQSTIKNIHWICYKILTSFDLLTLYSYR